MNARPTLCIPTNPGLPGFVRFRGRGIQRSAISAVWAPFPLVEPFCDAVFPAGNSLSTPRSQFVGAAGHRIAVALRPGTFPQESFQAPAVACLETPVTAESFREENRKRLSKLTHPGRGLAQLPAFPTGNYRPRAIEYSLIRQSKYPSGGVAMTGTQ